MTKLEQKFHDYLDRCERLQIEPISNKEWLEIQYVDAMNEVVKAKVKAGATPPIQYPTFDEWFAEANV